MKRIITFYSYKGGTGRSLLVANTAKFFAYCGYKVFVIDFDLEAPGMHYKFQVKPNEFGLIDYIHERQECTSQTTPLIKFVQKISSEVGSNGEIIFMPAGNAPSMEYADKLSQIKWDQIFSRSSESESINVPIIVDLIKKIINDFNPDFILVDSRTGLTDIGAITIKFMADQLVCLYHNNEESKDGSDFIIKTVESSNKENDSKIGIVKVLTRIPAKVKQGDIVLRSEPNLEITEELKFNFKKTLRESVLLRDYLNFFARLEPGITSNPKIKSIYKCLQDETKVENSDRSHSIKERIQNRGKSTKNTLKIANSKYITGRNFQSLINEIVDRLKKQNRSEDIETIPDENINWHMLGIQMREGVFDFCGEPFYLTKTRSHLVGVVQFGWLETFTLYLSRKSKIFKILEHNKKDIPKDLLERMKIVSNKVENLQIGTIGDYAASSEAYTILSQSQYFKGTTFVSKSNEIELWEWIAEKPENRMIICDHVIGEKFDSIQNEIKGKRELALKVKEQSYAFGEEILNYPFRERIPVGFLFPAEDIEWRREISRAFSQALFSFWKEEKDIWGDKSTNDTISHELKKVHIEPFSFDELWKNLVWDLPLKDANEWSTELYKIRNKGR
jgi:cellulose biosynthesis protein BcsQ